MIECNSLFEAASSSATEREEFANQRIADLKSARAQGRIDQKSFQNRLRYWIKVKSGSIGSPKSVESGASPGMSDLKTAGNYF
jgi:hypothetical protein